MSFDGQHRNCSKFTGLEFFVLGCTAMGAVGVCLCAKTFTDAERCADQGDNGKTPNDGIHGGQNLLL
jgi:hypothetical protein